MPLPRINIILVAVVFFGAAIAGAVFGYYSMDLANDYKQLRCDRMLDQCITAYNQMVWHFPTQEYLIQQRMNESIGEQLEIQ